MDEQVKFLIFECKGIVDSMSDLSEIGEEYDHPSLERLSSKLTDITNILLTSDVASGSYERINFDK